MEKIKVDVLINGDLICNNILRGGKLYPCQPNELNLWFDTRNALVLDGNVIVNNFDSKDYVVVVVGAVTAGGASHG